MNLFFNADSDTQKAIILEINKLDLSENLNEVEFAPFEIENNNFGEVFTDDQKPVIISNEHDSVYHSYKAFSYKYSNDSLGLVIFDSHAHASDEESVLGPDTYLRFLIDHNIIDPSRVFLCGVKNLSKSEVIYLKEKRIRVFTMKKIYSMGIDDFCDTLMESVSKLGKFFFSIDIDAIDYAFSKGTYRPEACGFTSREMLHLLQRLKRSKSYSASEITGICIDKDIDQSSRKIVAKLANELF